MQVGNRIIYDQDGEVLCQTGEMEGDVLPRKTITQLSCIDIPYKQVDFSKYRITRIDVNSQQPILEELPQRHPTYEELQQLLLIAEGVI